jgi:hypothetical protein
MWNITIDVPLQMQECVLAPKDAILLYCCHGEGCYVDTKRQKGWPFGTLMRCDLNEGGRRIGG